MSNLELNNTWTKLSSISKCAKENKTYEFRSLAPYLTVSFLKDCYNNLDRNKAVGVDKVSWQEYNRNLDENLVKLVQKLKNKSFRPHKNTHQALNQIDTTIMTKPVNHMVEADIKGFFDNVNHDMLIEFLNIRIKDSSLIFLIKRFLKAGYIDNRRSQKKSMSWSKLYSYLTLYPLPQPKIKHNFYTLSHKFVSYIEEPYEGNLQVRFCEGHCATPNYKLNLNKKEG